MSAVSKNVREQSVEQMVEYGTRMREQRDAALDRAERAERKVAEYEDARRGNQSELRKWAALAYEFIGSLKPRNAKEANDQAGLRNWYAENFAAAGTPKEAASDA